MNPLYLDLEARDRQCPRFKAVENSLLALKDNTLVLQRSLTAKHNSQPLEPENQRKQWHPTPVLLPGKSHEQRSLVDCSPGSR